MAVSFPLNLQQWSDRLRVIQLSYNCPTPKNMARTGDGAQMSARMGHSLWQGECTLGFIHQNRSGGIRAMLDLLMDENASFLLSPRDYYGPAADQGGVILGDRAGDVRVFAVATNNRDVTLSGLPPGYRITGDDLLSWIYGAAPIRYAFHRVVTQNSVANDAGQITVEVWPRVQPGWSATQVVQLVKPRFKAVMQETQAGTSARLFHDGISFRFVQSLR